MTIETSQQGYERTYVHGAVVSTLARFLSRDIDYIWLLSHAPVEAIQWWEAAVPLTRSEIIRARIRAISYDMELRTTDFIARAHALDDHGLVLIQSRNPMPDTLDIWRIPDEQQDGVLVKNGAFLRIDLPHAVETACVTCYQHGYLGGVNG